jgi:hypothetical protein
VDVNDADAIYGWVIIISIGLQQDQNKAIELWKQAGKLGFSQVPWVTFLLKGCREESQVPLGGCCYGWA